jgi:hypothetical protein
MNVLFEIIDLVCIICVFILKVLYLQAQADVLNTSAMVLICIFIVLQIVRLGKSRLMIAVFVFSFLAELFNLIYNGKSSATMLFYFGMHICLLVYLLRHRGPQIKDLFYELPLCTFILFIVYSWGFWSKNIFVYIAMVCYILLLCVNLTLSYSLNKKNI